MDETPEGFIVHRLAVDKALPELASLLSEQGLSRGDTWADMQLIGTACFVNHLGVNESGRGRQGGTGLLGSTASTRASATRHRHYPLAGGIRACA